MLYVSDGGTVHVRTPPVELQSTGSPRALDPSTRVEPVPWVVAGKAPVNALHLPVWASRA